MQKAPFKKLEKLVEKWSVSQSDGAAKDIDQLVDFLLRQEDTDLESLQQILEIPVRHISTKAPLRKAG